MNYIILENLRSAYNVGNVIRTADALDYGVIISGYSPSPWQDEKVLKTSLGAENSIVIKEFWDPKEALVTLKNDGYVLIAAEITSDSINISDFVASFPLDVDFAIIFGNEVEGVSKETLDMVDHIVHIPMKGHKESLNVGQSAAIFMREFSSK